MYITRKKLQTVWGSCLVFTARAHSAHTIKLSAEYMYAHTSIPSQPIPLAKKESQTAFETQIGSKAYFNHLRMKKS